MLVMGQLEYTSLMNHLMDHIRDNICFMDRDGRIILMNEAGAKWLGFNSPGEVIGKTDLDIFTNENGRAVFEDAQRTMETGEPLLGIKAKETRADGHETWVSTSKMPLRNNAGDAVVLFADGICEVAGAGQEEFGGKRLLAAALRHRDLSLQELFPVLIDEARRFSPEGSFDDDVFMVGSRLVDLLRS